MARQKETYGLNREERLRKNEVRRKAALAKQPLLWLFYGAKGRARKHGMPFNIEYNDLLPLPHVCPVLGIPIVYGCGEHIGLSDNSPSIDKTVPKLGYVRGNVVVMSCRANRLKADMSLEELEQITAYVRAKLQRRENAA